MWELPITADVGGIVLLHAPPREAMLTVTTRLALVGSVCVLDAGNQFDAYQVARMARRHTVEMDQVLDRIKVARAFTCYQVVSLFEQVSEAASAHIIFDLLATFYDENVSINESYRLLGIVTEHLKRLRGMTPVIILGAYPPRRNERVGLVQVLLNLADHTFFWEESSPPPPPKLNL